MADLKRFAKTMRIKGETVQSNATKLMKKVAVRVDQVVVTETPVDTGRARSNWHVDIGAAHEGTREPYAPGEGGSTGASNAAEAIAQGKQVIDGAQSGDEIHITNNLAYIGKLNEGHSAQAPAGYVEEAVMVAINSIRGDKITVEGGVK